MQSNVSIEQLPNCTSNSGNVVIGNKLEDIQLSSHQRQWMTMANQNIACSITTINSNELTNKLVQTLKGQLQGKVKTDQDGMFAFTTPVDTVQELNVRESTINNIRTRHHLSAFTGGSDFVHHHHQIEQLYFSRNNGDTNHHLNRLHA